MDKDKERFAFDFSPAAIKRLDELCERIDAASKSEVLRRALAVLDYVTSEECTVVLQYPDGEERTLILK